MKRSMIFGLALCAAAPAGAQTVDDVFSMSVRTGWRAADGTHVAAIEVRLASGWKTYWRQPGDAGIPPVFDWSGSENFETAQVVWPMPDISWDQGMRSIGYSDRVVFPLIVDPQTNGAIDLNGKIQLGICDEICIPVMVTVRAELPGQGAFDSTIQNAIDAQVPRSNQTVTCSFAPTSDSMQVELGLPQISQHKPDVVLEVAEPGLWIAEPTVARAGGQWHAQTEILSASGQPTAVSRSDVRITVFSDDQAIEYKGCTAP
ncbi:MAG: protein-disulfide reductase DsbD domain-containing protein [Pseudomonadota bacterium]